MSDPFDLQRFVNAQGPVYDTVLAELRNGRKQSHWMWFVFPQIAGLGQSLTARKYAIVSRAEASAYLDHPVLGLRLLECTRLVNAIDGRTAHEIFGTPDDLKFRSSMTLFAQVTSAGDDFIAALWKYFEMEFDPATIARL
jgi:uncharacterized protein (DUF1810 family)